MKRPQKKGMFCVSRGEHQKSNRLIIPRKTSGVQKYNFLGRASEGIFLEYSTT